MCGDARCAMRGARCAMRDAPCAMHAHAAVAFKQIQTTDHGAMRCNAECAMRDARCAMRHVPCTHARTRRAHITRARRMRARRTRAHARPTHGHARRTNTADKHTADVRARTCAFSSSPRSTPPRPFLSSPLWFSLFLNDEPSVRFQSVAKVSVS